MKKIHTAKIKIRTATSFGILILVFIVPFILPNLAMAQATTPAAPQYTLLAPLPGIPGTGNNCSATNSTTCSVTIQTYIIYIFKLMVALAVLAAVVMCIIGGFQYMLTDSFTKKDAAKSTIQNAIMGLLGALASYLILYTINPQLVNVSLVTVPKLNLATTTIDLNSTQTPTITGASAILQQNSENNAVQAINASNAAYAQEQTAQNNVNQLLDQMDAAGCPDNSTTPPCSDLETQLETAQDQVTQAQDDQTTQSAIASMSRSQNAFVGNDSTVSQFGPLGGSSVTVGGSDIEEAQTYLQSIDGAYNQAYTSIDNGDIADKNELTYQKTYEEAGIIQDYQTDTIVKSLSTDLLSPSSDQVAQANALIAKLQANQIPTQLPGSTYPVQIGTLSNDPTLNTQFQTDNQARIQKIQAACGKACGGK